MKVNEVMTSDVFVVNKDDTVTEAVKKLAEKGISGAPVQNAEGKLVGMITETDILNALKVKYKRLEMVYPSLSKVSVTFIQKFDNKEALEAFDEIATKKVGELMTSEILTVETGSELGNVVMMMMEKGINRVPVMDGDDIVGIVSRADIIKGLAKSEMLMKV